jgi:Cu-Zn family superoxide dismutase
MKFTSTLVLASLATALRTGNVDITKDAASDASNTITGTVKASQLNAEADVVFVVSLSGLDPSSTHGWHLHAQSVENNDCSTALGHYNPFEKTHGTSLAIDNINLGAPADEVRHYGDFGNFVVDAEGVASFNFTDRIATMYGDNAITTQAIVIHAGTDDLGLGGDEGSLATGNAGGRLGCGNFVVVEDAGDGDGDGDGDGVVDEDEDKKDEDSSASALGVSAMVYLAVAAIL